MSAILHPRSYGSSSWSTISTSPSAVMRIEVIMFGSAFDSPAVDDTMAAERVVGRHNKRFLPRTCRNIAGGGQHGFLMH